MYCDENVGGGGAVSDKVSDLVAAVVVAVQHYSGGRGGGDRTG